MCGNEWMNEQYVMNEDNNNKSMKMKIDLLRIMKIMWRNE